jgi:hypothetical protein
MAASDSVWEAGSAWEAGSGSPQPAAFSPHNRPEAGKTPAQFSSCSLFSLARARLSMAILVTRLDADTRARVGQLVVGDTR